MPVALDSLAAPARSLAAAMAICVAANSAGEGEGAPFAWEDAAEARRADLLGFGSAHANNAVAADAIASQRRADDVLNLIDRLPGVMVTHGDAIGGNDWSTRVYIRGMNTATDSSQIGYMVDDFPNGDSVYGDGQKPNRFIDIENVARAEVGQNAADIGSASNSALGGTVHLYSADPTARPGVRLALTGGQESLRRGFVRFDSGTCGKSAAYVSYSDTHLRSWPGAGSGRFDRRHVDLAATHEL